MSKIHRLVPTGPIQDVFTARLGAGNASTDRLGKADEGKFAKLVAESRYDLAAFGDPIETQILAVDLDPSGGYSVGSLAGKDVRETMFVIADGLQGTPGVGALAIGDYVLVGTPVAKGVAITAVEGYPRVCKSTVQLGGAPADLAAAGKQAILAAHAWRVVSLGPVGTGAVGTVIVIKPI